MRVLSVLVCILIVTSSAFALPFGDVLIQSAIGKSETPFTLLSFWNFGEGWLQPWVPPPSGEWDLQQGGWINTPSAFFSREIDPTFTFVRHTLGSLHSADQHPAMKGFWATATNT